MQFEGANLYDSTLFNGPFLRETVTCVPVYLFRKIISVFGSVCLDDLIMKGPDWNWIKKSALISLFPCLLLAVKDF